MSSFELPYTLKGHSINFRAAILMQNTRQEILLIGRKEEKMYSIPGGKFEQKNGQLLQTAMRECEEETGCAGNLLYFLGGFVDISSKKEKKPNYTAVFVFQFVADGTPSEDSERKKKWCNVDDAIAHLKGSRPEQVRVLERYKKKRSALDRMEIQSIEFDAAENSYVNQINRFLDEFEITSKRATNVLQIYGAENQLKPGHRIAKNSLQKRPKLVVENYENGFHYTFVMITYVGSLLLESQQFSFVHMIHGNIRSSFDGQELVRYKEPLNYESQMGLIMLVRTKDQIIASSLSAYDTDSYFDKEYKFSRPEDYVTSERESNGIRRKNWDLERFLHDSGADLISANVIEIVDK